MPLRRDPKQHQVGEKYNSRIVGMNGGKPRWVWDSRALSPRGVFSGEIPVGFFDTTTGVLYANDNTPSATETYVIEVRLPHPCRVTGIAIGNGSAVAGNVTVGLAGSDGIPIPGIVSASTVQAGTNAWQKIPFATPFDAEGPAQFFIMAQFSSASARYRGHKAGIHFCAAQTAQTYGALKAFTVPTGFAAAGAIIAQLY